LLVPHENTIIGNTVLYGATAGQLFASGQAGERFAVRNSGATAVIEGCGSNACEYMTGGVAVILGSVGHNFGAGMTGGMAYVYDADGHFENRINGDTVIYQRLANTYYEDELQALISEHFTETASPIAEKILAGWKHELPKFWQICPKEMVSRLRVPLSTNATKNIAGKNR
jgi:glutamate synthase (NADPH/NADH) large chain